MINWDAAYERLRVTPAFTAAFGKLLPKQAFRAINYTRKFEGVAAASTVGVPGTTSGPLLQTFPAGAVILGITAAAIQAQITTGSFTYAPSFTPGRRDLFALSFAYTSDEQITADGLTMAEALLGSGENTIFPSKELLIPPSQGILVSCASLTVGPTISAHVVFHCEVPRAA